MSLADSRKAELKNGDTVFFNVNRHLNVTNVCTASCAYCSFQRKPGQKDAYTMRVEEAVEKALDEGRRSHRVAHRQRPASDAAVEVTTPAIFDWDVRKQVVDQDTHWDDWSRIHRLAHEKGLRTPATMLYGHIEEPRHRVDHVVRLRELQDETGGFQVFIPLCFHNDNNRLSHLPMAQPAEVLKTFAVSRLMLDRFPHVKVFWVMHGLSTSQLALNFGADDMDGSVVEYKITHDADGYAPPTS